MSLTRPDENRLFRKKPCPEKPNHTSARNSSRNEIAFLLGQPLRSDTSLSKQSCEAHEHFLCVGNLVVGTGVVARQLT